MIEQKVIAGLAILLIVDYNKFLSDTEEKTIQSILENEELLVLEQAEKICSELDLKGKKVLSHIFNYLENIL